MWLYFAASDIAVSKLMTELTHENSKKADKIPMLRRCQKITWPEECSERHKDP
jgi:hypothetical protein